MNKKIDWTKPIRTNIQEYDSVRVICTDRMVSNDFKVVLLFKMDSKEAVVFSDTEGNTHGYGKLENKPKTIKAYFYIERDGNVNCASEDMLGVRYETCKKGRQANEEFIKEIEVEVP